MSTRFYSPRGNVTIMEVGIVARKGNPDAAAVADRIREGVEAHGETVWIDERTAAALDDETGRDVTTLAACDLAVAVGGDGTFLFAARNAGGTPVLGVNLGEVGFLNVVNPDDAEAAVLAAVEEFHADGIRVREMPRLAARTAGWESTPAVNEVVVQGTRRGPGGGIEYALSVDGARYSGGHADGVLVATPTGSTAYNLSEDGPLVHPDVGGLIVNEMAPAEGMPPLAVNVDATITVAVDDPDGAVVVSDGRNAKAVTGPVEVAIERTEPPVRIAGPESEFFEALDKLS